MSTFDTATPYEARLDAAAAGSVQRNLGEQVFLWLAWTLAFAFWALTMRTFFGILAALGSGAPGT